MKAITIALALVTIFLALAIFVNPNFAIMIPIAPLIAVHKYAEEEDC